MQGNVNDRLRAGLGKFGGRLAVLFIAIGIVAILLGYNGAASDPRVAAQIPYVLSGLGIGLAFLITGGALMVVQAAREDRARLEAKLDQIADALSRGGVGGGVGGAAVPANLAGLVVAGSASYHVPGCRLVDGREEVHYLTPEEAQARWLTPCRVCQPERAVTGSAR